MSNAATGNAAGGRSGAHVLRSGDVHPFEIPLTTDFRRVDRRAGVLVRGPAGWGEFSPFPDYDTDYAARWWVAAVEAATTAWPDPIRDRVPVNVTVPAVTADEAHAIVAGSSCTTAKVKVAAPGETEADDLARVEAVRGALGRRGRLRVDANGAWDLDTAAARLRQLDRFDLAYAEQPVADLDDMAALRRRVDVPLAVDEPVRRALDPLAVARSLAPGGHYEDAADILVVKAQPLGGVRAAREVVEAAGLPAVVSSALETSVGLAAGLALAATLPELAGACGLATLDLLRGDVVTDPLVAVDGAIDVRRPDASPELLHAWRPDRPRAEALIDRCRAAAAATSPYRVPGAAGDHRHQLLDPRFDLGLDPGVEV